MSVSDVFPAADPLPFDPIAGLLAPTEKLSCWIDPLGLPFGLDIGFNHHDQVTSRDGSSWRIAPRPSVQPNTALIESAAQRLRLPASPVRQGQSALLKSH
jgi:hypothetical protein